MSEKTHEGSGEEKRRTFLKVAGACGLAVSGMAGTVSAKEGNNKEDKKKPLDEYEGYEEDKKPAAVGKDAPKDLEPRSTIGTLATLTDSDSQNITAGGEDVDLELNTMMNGEFSSGLTATWEGDGSTETSATGSVLADDPDEVELTSEFTISGVNASIDLSGGQFGFVSDTKLRFNETFSNESEASHTYSGVEASSALVLYNATQSDSATYTYGTDSYTLTAQVKKF
jgi:hypothetical protein